MARRRRSRIPLVIEALERARARGRLHEYVVLETRREWASHQRGQPELRRGVDAERIEATIYRDQRTGRGSASFTLARDDEGDLDGLVAAAATRAGSGVGLAWQMPRPAAPARVVIAEPLPNGVDGALHAAQTEIDAALPTGHQLTRLEITAESTHTEVHTSTGFASEYPATTTRVNATLAGRDAAPGQIERVRCRGHRLVDLALAGRLRTAATRLDDLAGTARLPAGEYDLVLREAALLGEPCDRDDTGYGWFGPIVGQASGTLARQGLTRYPLGKSIFGKREVTGDPLSLASDGTIDFGLLSRPFGDLGEPVRRFELVSRGIATGYALDLREAALRGVTPNGGLRNLVVAPGTLPRDELLEPGTRPLIEVLALTWLETNPRTGGFVAELGLGRLHRGGATSPVVGGALTGNVFDLFARARLSLSSTARGWYYGPDAIRIDRATIR